MTPATFEMDSYMHDWTDDIDFGAFINFPPDDVDQGDIFGLAFFLLAD